MPWSVKYIITLIWTGLLRERVARSAGEGSNAETFTHSCPHPALTLGFALSGSRFARATFSRREKDSLHLAVRGEGPILKSKT